MNVGAIADLVRKATGKWARQRKSEERRARAVERRYDAMVRPRRVELKEAAWEVMQEADLKAGDGGRLPVPARMVMYAARPHILEQTGQDNLDAPHARSTLP
jgi:hypothetical protein